ncbi:MAG: aldo/keto reductase [Caldilineaceae bacterium]
MTNRELLNLEAGAAIAQGVLTGKFGRTRTAPGDNRNVRRPLRRRRRLALCLRRVEVLKPLAAEIDRPLAHPAIRWVIERPLIHTAVVGARLLEQVAQNAHALAGEILEGIFARMISDEVRLISRTRESISALSAEVIDLPGTDQG